MVVAMFYNEHGPPHFHVRYGEHRASVEVSSGVVLGSLPARTASLLDEWRVARQAELLDNWELARKGRPLVPIPPLE